MKTQIIVAALLLASVPAGQTKQTPERPADEGS
jgi:hypothetical protein